MSGKNKNTLSANKMIPQIQESFVTREMRNLSIIPRSLLPVHLHLHCPIEVEISRADFTLGDQSDDKRLSFSALARTKSQISTPKNMNLVQQSDKEETVGTISKKGK